jgi:hypothetical protein
MLSPEQDNVVGNDPGDDTAMRYRFQFTYAAIMCASILDDTMDIAEVFCEHLEDVLLQHEDGSLTGCQVKTRNPNLPPLGSTDEQILGACVRFAQLEHAYSSRFRRYQLATNHVFRIDKTGRSLPHLIDLARAAVPAGGTKLSSYVAEVAKRASVPEESVKTALSKIHCDCSLPKLEDAKARLERALLFVWPQAAERSSAVLSRAADHLVDECARASSLDHLQTVPAYLSISGEGPSREMELRIEGKRLDFERVSGVLSEVADDYELLEGPVEGDSQHQNDGIDLEEKLRLGGFSAISQASAIDLRTKAEHLAIRWLQRHGTDRGRARNDHVRSIVLSDCAQAWESTHQNDSSFGIAMQGALRERFAERSKDESSDLLGCTTEHLEGFAYVLSSECTVWWSES